MSFGLQRINSLLCSNDFFNTQICTPFLNIVGVTAHFWLVMLFLSVATLIMVAIVAFVARREIFLFCLIVTSLMPLLFVSIDIIIMRSDIEGRLRAVDHVSRNYMDFQVRRLLETQLMLDAETLCGHIDGACPVAVANVKTYASKHVVNDVNELKKANYNEALKTLTEIGRLAPLLAAIFIPVIGYVAKLVAEEAPVRIRALPDSSWTERITYLSAVALCSLAAASLIASLGYAANLLNIKVAGMIGGDMITARTIERPYFSQYESLMFSLILTAIGFIFIVLIRRNDPKEPETFDIRLNAPNGDTSTGQMDTIRFEIVMQSGKVAEVRENSGGGNEA